MTVGPQKPRYSPPPTAVEAHKRKRPKLSVSAALIGGTTLVLIANWLTVRYISFPFLYCWGQPVVWPVYDAFANYANVAAICYFAYEGLRRNVRGMLVSGIFVVLVMGIPIYAVTLFKLGGSCGV